MWYCVRIKIKKYIIIFGFYINILWPSSIGGKLLGIKILKLKIISINHWVLKMVKLCRNFSLNCSNYYCLGSHQSLLSLSVIIYKW